MQIEVTKKEQLQTNTWSGGTTTQLVIYPKNAQYKNLDFTFRISTATIDVEESTFTVLPNVTREIMVLDGELLIQHKNYYTKQLKKFDSDSFLGDWHTTSIGKATDFNVMTRGNAKATVEGIYLSEKENKELPLDSNLIAIYVYKGEVCMEQPSLKIVLLQGDIALIYNEQEGETIKLHAVEAAEIALAHIYTELV